MTLSIGQALYGVEQQQHKSLMMSWARAYIEKGWKVIPFDIYRSKDGKKNPVCYFEFSKINWDKFDFKMFERLVYQYCPGAWFSALRLMTRESQVVVVDRDGKYGQIITDAFGAPTVSTHNSTKNGHLWFAGDIEIPRYVRPDLQFDVPTGVFVAPSLVLSRDRWGTLIVDGVYKWSDGISLQTVGALSLPVLSDEFKTFLMSAASRSSPEMIKKFKSWTPTKDYITRLLIDPYVDKGNRHRHLLKLAGAILKCGENKLYTEHILTVLCTKRGWHDKKKEVKRIVEWMSNKQKQEQQS